MTRSIFVSTTMGRPVRLLGAVAAAVGLAAAIAFGMQWWGEWPLRSAERELAGGNARTRSDKPHLKGISNRGPRSLAPGSRPGLISPGVPTGVGCGACGPWPSPAGGEQARRQQFEAGDREDQSQHHPQRSHRQLKGARL